MTNMAILAACLVLGLTSLSAQEESESAQTQSVDASSEPAAATTTTETRDPGAERVCKREKTTGTRLASSRKVCMTRAEWDELARKSREEYDRINGPLLNPCENNRCDGSG